MAKYTDDEKALWVIDAEKKTVLNRFRTTPEGAEPIIGHVMFDLSDLTLEDMLRLCVGQVKIHKVQPAIKRDLMLQRALADSTLDSPYVIKVDKEGNTRNTGGAVKERLLQIAKYVDMIMQTGFTSNRREAEVIAGKFYDNPGLIADFYQKKGIFAPSDEVKSDDNE